MWLDIIQYLAVAWRPVRAPVENILAMQQELVFDVIVASCRLDEADDERFERGR